MISEKPIPAKKMLTDNTRKLRFHIGVVVLAIEQPLFPKTKRELSFTSAPLSVFRINYQIILHYYQSRLTK